MTSGGSHPLWSFRSIGKILFLELNGGVSVIRFIISHEATVFMLFSVIYYISQERKFKIFHCIYFKISQLI